jgi:tetratricopeptide (TPR) repeat protein
MQKDWKLIGLGAFFLVMLCVTYSNHFKNGFYFDDHHTITNNTWVRDLKNIPKFFTDYTTMSIDPNNQGSMRPVITTLNAIDYAIAGKKYDQRVFHAHMFFNYVWLCVLLYFLILFIFNAAHKDDWNKYIALICAALYAHLAGNAETINYIISRSDSFSTFCIVATFALYTFPKTKKYYLYLIPLIIGFLSKENAFVTPFVFFFFIAFFQEQMSLPDLVKPSGFKKLFNTGKAVIPIFLILLLGIIFRVSFYLPKEYGVDIAIYDNTVTQRLDYFMTQSYCILRYFLNLFFPTDLTADPDIYIVSNYLDLKVIFGLFFLFMLFITAVFTSNYKKTRPIAFGIIWFYMFLMPTSSFIVMHQISNDHRPFLPYIGLIFSFGWTAALLVFHLREKFNSKSVAQIAFGIAFLFISVNALGAYQRNHIWSSNELLWGDVVKKSPGNPRGLMNYGLALMAKGQLVEAQSYYEKALSIWPSWFYAHINMGIVLNSQGKLEEAEKYYANAMNYGKHSPEPFYFYGRYLYEHERYNESKEYLEKGLALSPQHGPIKTYLDLLVGLADMDENSIKKMQEMAEETNSFESYINLSLSYYKLKQFENSAKAAEKAVEINPESAIAYNNVCAAQCALGNWQAAIAACNKALEIDPGFERAKNNLNWAESELAKK